MMISPQPMPNIFLSVYRNNIPSQSIQLPEIFVGSGAGLITNENPGMPPLSFTSWFWYDMILRADIRQAYCSDQEVIDMSITELPHQAATPLYERMTAAQKTEIVGALSKLLGARYVLHSAYDLTLYEYDASIDRGKPDIVVLPASTEEVVGIVKIAAQYRVPVVPRGAGTGLSGGAIPIYGGIVIGFSRMNRILEIDYDNLRAVVQPGLVNLHLSNALNPSGFYYVPDPSSQRSCTLGGNVGENAGGPHTLIYGVTTNHVLGLEIVTPDGEVVHTGGKAVDAPGYDLTGLFCGSEGTMGIVTKIIVKLTPVAELVKTLLGVFETVEQASQTVSDVI